MKGSRSRGPPQLEGFTDNIVDPWISWPGSWTGYRKRPVERYANWRVSVIAQGFLIAFGRTRNAAETERET
jgi:hypothetical protein